MTVNPYTKWLVIGGSLLIGSIKWLIRPVYPNQDVFLFFLNIAPNFLGAFLLPFAAGWLGSSQLAFAGWLKTESRSQLRLVCIAGFGLLVINEYLQKIPFFGRTFDPNDILFSAIGLAGAYVLFPVINYPEEPVKINS